MRIGPDSIIGDLLDAELGCEQVFERHGMQCTGCPSARGETLEEACEVHGIALDALLDELHRQLQGS